MKTAAELLAKVLSPAAIDDAVLDAVTLSACADGVSKSELDAVMNIARALPTLAGRPEAEVRERIEASFERVNRDGLEQRLLALGAYAADDDARRRLFTAALVVQYADGRLTSEENAFLFDLADVLGLSSEAVREIASNVTRELGTSA